MSDTRIDDLNIESNQPLITPNALKALLPLSDQAARSVMMGRETIKRILKRDDPRLLIVVGPCSIHDPEAAIDYGRRLITLQEQVKDSLCLVMRVYFEKPRTTVGWKGLLNDPRMNDSFEIEEGLKIGRRLLLDLAEMGLPLATEALDPISPQYLQDLISWSAIGARTAESQTHREMSSGLSGAVGFKNGTDGNLDVAINAMQSVSHPHNFLGISAGGQVSIVRTRGNRYAHIVLRGGADRPNYDTVSVSLAEQALAKAKLPENIMIDCSHANSSKDPARQPLVARDATHQIVQGNRSIVGLMIESNIHWGNQSIPADLSELKYGVSVTDACIDWPTTEACLVEMDRTLKSILPDRSS